jgi:hypothetical protein
VDEDLSTAIDVFFREAPSLREVVIWGLCDAASSALMYVPKDRRVSGLVLANPWVRTPEGLANAMVKHYYGSRLLQREFWQKLLSGRFDIFASLRGFVDNLRGRGSRTQAPTDALCRFRSEWRRDSEISGPVLLSSGQDLTA